MRTMFCGVLYFIMKICNLIIEILDDIVLSMQLSIHHYEVKNEKD